MQGDHLVAEPKPAHFLKPIPKFFCVTCFEILNSHNMPTMGYYVLRSFFMSETIAK